jgi:hypothetical protein
MKNLHELNRHRRPKLEIELYGSIGGSDEGVFAFRSPVDSKVLWVIASKGDGWEHVSVSKATRTPSWAEMEFIKRLFFRPDEVCMQLHVSETDHISFHDHCLHIWRPLADVIPLPPAWMVGPRTKEIAA